MERRRCRQLPVRFSGCSQPTAFAVVRISCQFDGRYFIGRCQRCRGELLRDPARVVAQGKVGGVLEKVVDPHAREFPPREEALTGLPQPKQKVRLLREQRGQIERPLNIRGLLTLCDRRRHRQMS